MTMYCPRASGEPSQVGAAIASLWLRTTSAPAALRAAAAVLGSIVGDDDLAIRPLSEGHAPPVGRIRRSCPASLRHGITIERRRNPDRQGGDPAEVSCSMVLTRWTRWPP